MILLNDSVRQLKRVGPKTEELYNKLGIFSVRDLLNYFPRDYFIYEEPIKKSCLEEGRIIAAEGTIISQPLLRRTKNGDVTIAHMECCGEMIELLWFKAPYIRSVIKKNMTFVMHGKLSSRSGRLLMMHPKIFKPDEYYKLKGKLLPVYGLTKGLSNKQISDNVREALEVFKESEEYSLKSLPPCVEEMVDFPEYGEALCQLHFPVEKESFIASRRRFAFEEFFYFRYAMRKMEELDSDNTNTYLINDFSLADRWLNTLPFKPTNDQMKAINDIKQDFFGKKCMQRMLQGDVGSGKTLVAFYACLSAAANGYQSALMAPTEVLANQHFNTFTNWCNGLDANITVVLLTGALKAKEKREAYEKISTGKADIVVGTHALIQESLVFKNLAFSVTDEQHRFGVMQRTFLMEKGFNVHSLFMTATPIPRTLAILMYGNTDISVLNEKPANRLPIKNCMIPYSKRNTAFNFIAKEINAGHQAFMVCPMIEENEMFECENIHDYEKTVNEYFKGQIKTAVLHGKMTSSKKEEVMREFNEGKAHILISTTVIEVGIDIPNATVMMVENAERFGLSQLHQLRGRVGRGKAQSYCIFVNTSDSDESRERIEVLVKSNDGFHIAKEDLKFRGPGDLFGVKQSGDMDFKFADIFSDSKLLELAARAVDKINDTDISEETEQILNLGLVRYEKNHINCI